MDCFNAELLMMKYMDEEISVEESKQLNEHILVCGKCAEAFAVYDELVSGIAEIEPIVAPIMFEKEVMAKIEALPEKVMVHAYSRRDKIKLWVAGSFVTLFTIGMMLVIHRDLVFNALAKNPVIGEYVVAVKPVSDFVATKIGELLSTSMSVLSGIDTAIASGASLIIGAIAVLCAVQLVLVHKKNR